MKKIGNCFPAKKSNFWPVQKTFYLYHGFLKRIQTFEHLNSKANVTTANDSFSFSNYNTGIRS